MPISFRLLNDSLQTLSAQIQQQVELAIAKNELVTGESVPSVRQLALTLKVNPNTVAKAFQLLVQSGSLVSQRGKGYFVADNTKRFSKIEKKRQLKAAAERFVAKTRPLGLDKNKLLMSIEQLLQEGDECDNS